MHNIRAGVGVTGECDAVHPVCLLLLYYVDISVVLMIKTL